LRNESMNNLRNRCWRIHRLVPCQVAAQQRLHRQRSSPQSRSVLFNLCFSFIFHLLIMRFHYYSEDDKYEHLRALEGDIRLIKAYILDNDSLVTVMRDCDETSCPQEQVMDPVIKGTTNVLDAIPECEVKRLVLTSSMGPVYMDPNRDPHLVVDEERFALLHSNQRMILPCKYYA
ncbi:hypothetical protein KI387_030490, partial [Taxus chinensis]